MFLHNTGTGPSISARVQNGGTKRHVQRRVIAAGTGSPLVYELPACRTYAWNRTGILSREFNIMLFYANFNIKTGRNHPVSGRKRLFFQPVQVCCIVFYRLGRRFEEFPAAAAPPSEKDSPSSFPSLSFFGKRISRTFSRFAFPNSSSGTTTNRCLH